MTDHRHRWPTWELLLANLAFTPVLVAAWVRLGAGQALAFVGALLFLDWRILRRKRGER